MRLRKTEARESLFRLLDRCMVHATTVLRLYGLGNG